MGSFMAVSDFYGHGAKMSCRCELILCRSMFCLPWSALRSKHKKKRIAMSLFIGFHTIENQRNHPHPSIVFTSPQQCVLPLTKSGQRLQNVPETVMVTDPLVFGFTPAHKHFEENFTVLVVGSPSSIQWHPHSLRRGGAKTHCTEFGNLN